MQRAVWTLLFTLMSSTAWAAPDLSLDLTGPAQVTLSAGNPSYNVAVRNIGNAAMPRATVTVSLPASVQLVSVASGCSIKQGPYRLECVYFNQNAGVLRNFAFVAASPSVAGSWSFQASVAGNRIENTMSNNQDSLTTALVAPAPQPLPIVATQTVHAYVCWDPAQSVATCSPYALDEQVFDLAPQHEVITGDPGVVGTWFQSPSFTDLELFFHDATSSDLLAEMSLVTVSSTCFEGTALYSLISPSSYNIRICL